MIQRLWHAVVCLCLLALAACNAPDQANMPTSTTVVLPTEQPTPATMQPLQDTFDTTQDKRVRTGTISNARFAIANGRYTVTVTETNTLVWSTVGGMFANGSAETDIFFKQGTPATAAGMLFRMQDDQNFYMASVSSDGFYALDARENGNWRSIIEWTRWPTIDTRGQPNRLRVQAEDATISLYINGTLLVQTVDQAFTRGGFALAVNTFDTPDVSVQFDNLDIQPAVRAAHTKE